MAKSKYLLLQNTDGIRLLVATSLIGTDESIALRVPNSTLTVALLKETGPLAITSANPSGACDCTHHNKVDDLIASKIDYILADGKSLLSCLNHRFARILTTIFVQGLVQ